MNYQNQENTPTMPRDQRNVAIPALGWGTAHRLALGSTSAQAPQLATTNVIRLVATVDCHIAIGTDTVSASASHTFLPAGQIEYVKVNQGDYVAGVQASAPGFLYITETT